MPWSKLHTPQPTTCFTCGVALPINSLVFILACPAILGGLTVCPACKAEFQKEIEKYESTDQK